MFEHLLAPFLTLLGSAGMAAIVVKWMERRKTEAETVKTTAEADKTDAEATDIITKASTQAVEMMKGQLTDAYTQIGVLRDEVSAANTARSDIETELAEEIRARESAERKIARLEKRVAQLEQHLRDLGEDP